MLYLQVLTDFVRPVVSAFLNSIFFDTSEHDNRRHFIWFTPGNILPYHFPESICSIFQWSLSRNILPSSVRSTYVRSIDVVIVAVHPMATVRFETNSR